MNTLSITISFTKQITAHRELEVPTGSTESQIGSIVADLCSDLDALSGDVASDYSINDIEWTINDKQSLVTS